MANNQTDTGKGKELAKLEIMLQRDDIQKRFHDMLGRRAPAFISSIISAYHSNADLANCEPMSVISSAAVAASLDLPINPNLSLAHIVPYAGKGTFQMGWRGFVQLALRTGKYENLHAGMVYEGELVEYNHITGEIKFDLKGKKSDKIIGYVAYLKLLSGFTKYLYMTYEEVMAHALKYSKLYASKGTGQWKTNFPAMALKTVLKMLLGKYGLLTVELMNAITSDEAYIKEDGTPEYIDGKISDAEEKRPETEEPQELKTGKGAKKTKTGKSKKWV